MYIYRTDSFVQPATAEKIPLKELLRAAHCSPSLRRAGRFNQLAVLGAKQCCEGFELPAECDLIVTSVNGPIANTGIMLQQVIQQQQIPMPFNFMNSQNNSACFYVAQELGIRGSSLVCMHPDYPLESAMTMALAQWAGRSKRPVLVGHVDEWTLTPYHHPTGYSADETSVSMEGSCWFLLSHEPLAGMMPLARLLELKLMLSEEETITLLKRHACHLNPVAWDLDQASKDLLAREINQSDSVSLSNASQLEQTKQLSDRLKQCSESHYCRVRREPSGGFRILLLERDLT